MTPGSTIPYFCIHKKIVVIIEDVGMFLVPKMNHYDNSINIAYKVCRKWCMYLSLDILNMDVRDRDKIDVIDKIHVIILSGFGTTLYQVGTSNFT